MKEYFLATLAILLLSISAKAQTPTFTLKSKDLSGQFIGEQVFNSFGCTGENQSPQLYWENTPKGTKSFAVTMYDPDAPTGSGWWHWLVFDLTANTKNLPKGAGLPGGKQAPKGAIQSRTDYGTKGYGGPCPPEGDRPHAYIITVYALPVEKLGPDENASPALVGYYLEQQALAKASLLVYHQRPKPSTKTKK